jgi:hypothetical protein
MSCLLDGFGYFEIAGLFVTGSFLRIRDYNIIYDHMIITEMKKEFTRLIREKTHRTKFDLLVDTSSKLEERSKYTTNLGYKHFCYDTFSKGDPHVVANTTYILGTDVHHSYFTLGHLLQFSHNRSGLIIRGDELRDRRIKVDVYSNKYQDLRFCKNLIYIH